ncbi:unnamed protein product [Polarella glacialis]|uniref:Uncharacterized protein n=1 Tax=Polarella glacialis TaxID=89957 RepID=A0A813GSX8_POLGL|nr:unnamed protein product [Polarella glacialis]
MRYFEVSKTGRWRLLGPHFKFESTVIVREDWQQMQATYRQARPGAMRHFSGFWQVVPTGKSESLVMFYTEAIPGFILPAIFRSFDRRALEDMARSLLQDDATANNEDMQGVSFFEMDASRELELEDPPCDDEKGEPEMDKVSEEEKLSASEDPEGLVNMLSLGIKSVRVQAKKSETKLKGMFHKAFKAGVLRHTALLKQQKILKQSEESMKKFQVKKTTTTTTATTTTRTTTPPPTTTNNNLETRIHGTGEFLVKLEKVALASEAEVPEALRALRSPASTDSE